MRLTVLIVAVLMSACVTAPGDGARAQAADPIPIRPGDARVAAPDFTDYEAEYASAFGRFTNQIRAYTSPDGAAKISVINLIHMPQGVIVDHRGIDRTSMRVEFFHSPFFAWGQDYVVGAMNAAGYDWTRVPLGGGEPTRTHGDWDTGGVFDSLGFSPTLAALMPMDVGTRFSIPRDQPRADGTVIAVDTVFAVVARERLALAGVSCECWVLEETDASGARNRYWVARQAPFLFRRHRDIGGQRDFVSDLLSFRALD